ncbi:MAG: hypothetical protein CVU97_04160 [Firmicutes bacterium HGW-Firmicutes-21]|nr:MAG: hypothetical protein CVU97_04160 [Firmicutes bacterium HGW-Firmicutes-21]
MNQLLMNKTAKTITAIFFNGLTVFIGVYGIVFGVITAYNIDIDSISIVLMCIASAIFFSVAFTMAEAKKILYIVAAAALAIVFFIYRTEIINGFLLFLNMITARLNNFSDSVTPTKGVVLTRFGKYAAYTKFFGFFGVSFAALLSFLLIKVRSLWLLIFVSLSGFSICLIFVKEIPDIGPVIAYFVYLTSVIVSHYIRKGDRLRGAGMLSVFLPLTLVFLLLINTAFPDGVDNRTGFADWMYSYFSNRLPINPNINNSITGSLDESYGTSGEHSSWSNSSGSTSSSPVIEVKDYQSVDLVGADPSQTGKVILQINTNKAGKQLLRGFSLDAYTGTSWEQFSKNRQNSLNQVAYIDAFTDTFNYSSFATPMSYAAYVAMTSQNPKHNYIYISESESGGEIVYTPYYSVFTDLSTLKFHNNSVVLYGPNANYLRDEYASYNFNFFNCDNIYNEPQKQSDARDTISYEAIRELERRYREYAYMYYTEVNTKTSIFLNGFIEGEGFRDIEDRRELVEAVTEFVKSSAKYNLNARRTPQGRDYIEYFLSTSKEGYCMQFATSATMIFRTLGIPARYVSGYSVDVKDNMIGDWIDVTDKNAHAWVEVYFDEIGWIPVDVTPGVSNGGSTSSQPEVSHASSNPSTESSKPSVSSEPDISSEMPSQASESSSESYLSSNESIPYEVPKNTHPYWIYAVLFGGIAIVSLFYRRRNTTAARKKAFTQEDSNKAVISAWRYIERLKPYGLIPDEHIYALAQKAAFSRHTLTDEERHTVIDYATVKGTETENNLNFIKRFIFRYIMGLH